jgi:hypothetical protein
MGRRTWRFESSLTLATHALVQLSGQCIRALAFVWGKNTLSVLTKASTLIPPRQGEGDRSNASYQPIRRRRQMGNRIGVVTQQPLALRVHAESAFALYH